MRNILLLCVTTLLLQAENLTNSLGMKFVKIPSGTFMMGRDAYFEEGNSDELPQHKQHIKTFYMQTTEVTQAQWLRIMGSNPSQFKGNNNPVDSISYYDAQRFIKKLNKIEGTTRYRLPTEAEWEYAARAKTTTTYHFGNNKAQLKRYAWYDKNARNRTHPVAQKRPNKWGLYDIHGNVSEWTSSAYTKKYQSRLHYNYRDGTIPRVLRGGCCFNDAYYIRIADRNGDRPNSREVDYGFRLVRSIIPKRKRFR